MRLRDLLPCDCSSGGAPLLGGLVWFDFRSAPQHRRDCAHDTRLGAVFLPACAKLRTMGRQRWVAWVPGAVALALLTGWVAATVAVFTHAIPAHLAWQAALTARRIPTRWPIRLQT